MLLESGLRHDRSQLERLCVADRDLDARNVYESAVEPDSLRRLLLRYDLKWKNQTLFKILIDTSVNGNSGSLVSCGGNRWCCQPRVADSTCNCDTGKGNFLLSAGSAQTIIGAVGLDRLSTGTLTATRASTATTSSSTSKTSTSLAPSPNTLNIATSTSSRDPATATGPPNQVAVTSKVAFKAGIGAGSAVVGLILAFVAFCWGKKRRDRKQQGGTSPIAMVPSQEFMGAVHQEPLPRPPMHDPYNPMNSVLLLDKDDAPPRYNTRSAYGNRPYPDPYQPESGI
ncbi:MAG: hypothetical protein M1812_008194 [Candelaria pacifica]|nr:MAG: hypothetical protein M1812_008194 [Candelaria pacifica]